MNSAGDAAQFHGSALPPVGACVAMRRLSQNARQDSRPPFSPFAMLARLMVSPVAAWEVVLSVAILVGTILVVGLATVRIVSMHGGVEIATALRENGFSVDLAAFYNDYDKLSTIRIGDAELINNGADPLHFLEQLSACHVDRDHDVGIRRRVGDMADRDLVTVHEPGIGPRWRGYGRGDAQYQERDRGCQRECAFPDRDQRGIAARLLASRPMLFLGEISYEIFLLHVVTMALVMHQAALVERLAVRAPAHVER